MKNILRGLWAAVACLVCGLSIVACADGEKTIDYGTLTIADMTVAVNETATIEPIFSLESGRGEVSYAFDGQNISIADGAVTGLVDGSQTAVTATTEHLSTTFTVTVGSPDRGTLTIANLKVDADSDGVAIVPKFSTQAGKSEIVYTFEGNNIAIENGVIKPLVPDTQTTVTATTPYHTVTFVVVVRAIDYGKLSVTAPRVYANYPAQELKVAFSKPQYAGTVVYTVENRYKDRLIVEDGKVRAVGDFSGVTDIKVTATTAHHTTTFTVRVTRFDGATASGDSLHLENSVNRLLDTWNRGGGEKGGTLFIGDSFFDVRWFWTDFYTTFARKNVFTMGISSTTTTDWELLAHRLVYPLEPETVVMHCGTNNIFDDGENAATATANIIKLFEQMHGELPDTDIYYFGIEPRVGQGTVVTKACNRDVKAYCDDNDWLYYIDSPSFCYEADGVTIKNSFYKQGDSVHPALASYALYLDALEDLGVTYKPSAAASSTTIAAFTTSVDDKVASSRTIMYRGMGLRKEYVLTGKIDVTAVKNNAHIQMPFSDFGNRFLLWDSDSNGKLGVGWACGGTHVNELAQSGAESFVFTAGGTLTIDFKLIVTQKNAYFYVGTDGALRLAAVFKNVPVTHDLQIGSEGAAVRVYDMTAKTAADDMAEYDAAVGSATEIAPYEADGSATVEVMRHNG